MHFQSLVLVALSAGALALPSKDHVNPGYPTIAPYNDGDCTQEAGASQSFQNSANDCIKLEFTQDNVGINWGASDWLMSSFDVFTDDACQNYAAKTIKSTGNGNDATGPNACYSMRLYGGPWKSVRRHFEQEE